MNRQESTIVDRLDVGGDDETISSRINFALDRKYRSEIPSERGPRSHWVAEHFDTPRPTADGWLFGNRKPRDPALDKIAADTGVEKKWLVHGGVNPYRNVPYQEPQELDNFVKMKTYAALSSCGDHRNKQQVGMDSEDLINNFDKIIKSVANQLFVKDDIIFKINLSLKTGNKFSDEFYTIESRNNSDLEIEIKSQILVSSLNKIVKEFYKKDNVSGYSLAIHQLKENVLPYGSHKY